MKSSDPIVRSRGPLGIHEVYESTFRFVVFVLRRLHVQEQDIEEIAHDVYVTYIHHAGNIDPNKVNAWLAVTARNRAFDLFRKHAARKTTSDSAAVENAESGTWSATLDDCRTRENALAVSSALESWSRRRPGGVLDAFYLDGKSARRIASERGLKTSSITSALTRERKKFRAFVETL
jgi:RNA polymerase sigma factor (sigma-70 family)